jgi:hypothetical protein
MAIAITATIAGKNTSNGIIIKSSFIPLAFSTKGGKNTLITKNFLLL